MIIKFILSLLIFTSICFSKEFTIASYNVENLFDMHYNKTEYKEYIPNSTSKWTKQSYQIKLKNISKVINKIDASIMALQEIESKKAFNDLLKKSPQYKYSIFKKYKNSSIGLGFFSKYPIKNYQLIHVKYSKVKRPILEVSFIIEGNEFIVYNNHWPSKRNKESHRVSYAQSIEKVISKHKANIDYVILGDLNSNYNEYQTFKNSKLNNTYGHTGINDVLLSRFNSSYISSKNISEYKTSVHFNPWLELSHKNRFSYKFKNKNETPDNFLLPKSLFDNYGISYKPNSFNVFKPQYLISNGKINRWHMKKRVHKNKGFSDHLPIFAKFSTSNNFVQKKENSFHINSIYDNSNYILPKTIKNLFLMYKKDELSIIKEKNNRAIFVYKNSEKLDFNKLYDLQINQIKNFNGLLEITNFDIVNSKNATINIKDFYLDAKNNDILNFSFQNEIITNLRAIYKKGYLHYKFKNENRKIRLYSKDKSLLPNNGDKVYIINAHLGFFGSKPQIIIYKKSDFKYVD